MRGLLATTPRAQVDVRRDPRQQRRDEANDRACTCRRGFVESACTRLANRNRLTSATPGRTILARGVLELVELG
jgi:hypothetical protein